VTWIKLDVSFARHRKVKQLSDGAFRLHVTSKCHAGEFLTDGFIHFDEISDLTRHKKTENLVNELLDAGLWETVSDGYQIHDYLEHQESKAQVEARRAADRERKRGAKKKDSKQIPDGIQTESKQIPDVDKIRRDEIEKGPQTPTVVGASNTSSSRPRVGSRADGTNPRAVAEQAADEAKHVERLDSLRRYVIQRQHLASDEFAETANHDLNIDDLAVAMAFYDELLEVAS